MPFGEELFPDGVHRTTNLKYTFGDNVRQKFTGYQKDNETNLDFAEARMYANNFGRFTAVDPLLASGRNEDPQTFNRYVYCLNNPVNCVDPTGLDPGIWTYRNRQGGREYKWFRNNQEITDYNSLHSSDFCKNNPSCVDYQVWTGGNWVLWADRTGAHLGDNGVLKNSPFRGLAPTSNGQTLFGLGMQGRI